MASPSSLHIAVEAHSCAATLYLSGTLTIAGALRAGTACEELPPRVKTLRVDLRGLIAPAPLTLRALAIALRRWRVSRAGNAWRDGRRLRPRAGGPAWRRCGSADALGEPFVAVVTRSLQYRTRFETELAKIHVCTRHSRPRRGKAPLHSRTSTPSP